MMSTGARHALLNNASKYILPPAQVFPFTLKKFHSWLLPPSFTAGLVSNSKQWKPRLSVHWNLTVSVSVLSLSLSVSFSLPATNCVVRSRTNLLLLNSVSSAGIDAEAWSPSLPPILGCTCGSFAQCLKACTQVCRQLCSVFLHNLEQVAKSMFPHL